ncbi:ATP-binding cassette domain-containing protein, partial [Turicibacter sanguinis]|nr:ATP-binding cassette domain-containing protein [Turicibacter sanguinis]
NIFQNYALMENCTIKENLKIAIRYQKKKKYDFKEVLKRVGLEHIDLNTKIYELSGGEQQRIALARVILQDSQYIFADEPTGNLDEENTEKVFNILKELNQEGKTIILVTHDKGLAERCKRIIHL